MEIDGDSIYSYYVEKGGEIFREKLTDHVKEALSTVSCSKQSKISQYIEKILGSIDIRFAEAVRLSIIFHDIGKIFYQKNYKYDKIHNNIRYLSFTGHEFLSSYIFDKFAFRLASSETLSKTLSACNFSILFHHHAMNPKYRASPYREPITVGKAAVDDVKIERLKILNQFLKSSEVEPWRAAINDVEVEVKKSKDVNAFIGSVVSSMFSPQGLGKKIWRIFISDSIFRKTSLALLSTLLVADYFSALKLRPESKPSTFHNVLREFYSYYLSNTFTEPKK